MVRAARSRFLTHVCLAGLAAVVVAALLVAGQFTGQTGLTWGFALPLVVLAGVAFPTAGAELAAARREELGVSRLRGMHGRWYLVDLVAEPALSLLVGALLGVALGVCLNVAAGGRMARRGPAAAPGTLLAISGSTVVGGLLLLLLGMGRALREPVSAQIADAARPRPAGAVTTFFSVFVFVAAVLAAYRSGQNRGGDLVVLAGPAILGLAAGQAAVWAARGTARLLLRRRGSLAGSLAWRRVARGDVLGAPMSLLVAAGVVAAVAMGGAAATTDWSRDAGRIAAGAPLVLTFPGTPEEALRATHRADPQGEWLMAGARLFSDDRAQSRETWLDTARYHRVVGDFLAGTPAGAGSRMIARDAARLRQPPPGPLTTGDRWNITATMRDFRRAADVHVDVQYAGDAGPATRTINVRVPPRSTRSAEVRLPDCRHGCRVTAMSVGEGPPCAGSAAFNGLCDRPRFSLTALDFGGINLLRQPWTPVASAAGHADGVVDFGRGTADVRLTKTGRVDLQAPASALAVPALMTRGIAWDPGDGPVVRDVGGTALPPRVLGRFAALPVVAAAGSLADLPQALQRSAPPVPAITTLVLARADTPAGVLRAVSDGHAGRFVPAAAFEDRLAADAEVVRSRGYAVIAVACLLLGPLSLGLTATRQREDQRRQTAALRLVKVSGRQRRRARLYELALECLAAGLLVGLGAWCAEHYLLGSLPLLDLPAHQAAVDVSVRWGSVVTAALVIAVIAALVHAAVRTTTREATAPATLREGLA